MKIVVIGGVSSTKVLVDKLYEYQFKDVHVFGYSPSDTKYVSGWNDLEHLAKKCGFNFTPFKRVSECYDSISNYLPDYLFAVGLSQIIDFSKIKHRTKANIGFHPTKLPKGRGRAALAWLILEEKDGAATFFEMNNSVDDGPIYVQENFEVTSSDNVASIGRKILDREKKALDTLLPMIMNNSLTSYKQDFNLASWYGKRNPEDGCINWNHSYANISSLVRASTYPYPGAFTYFKEIKIIILDCAASTRNEKGVIGRIVYVHNDNSFEIQTADQLMLVKSWESEGEWLPKVGMLLGYITHVELAGLKNSIRLLNQEIDKLKKLIK